MLERLENPYMPLPQARGETYGAYCERLEEAVVTITVLKNPDELAIKALAFIAMEAPSDFDCAGQYAITPFNRIKNFLKVQSSECRTIFRFEAKQLPLVREDRVNYLLSFD